MLMELQTDPGLFRLPRSVCLKTLGTCYYINPISISFQQRLLARAQYDNIAETPDELAFKKGDIITIVEQDTGGLEGWWLCSLRGKQGIAPGNRLKLMSGTMVHHERSQTADYPSPTHESMEWHRRSWDGSTNKVMKDEDIQTSKSLKLEQIGLQ